MPLTITTPSTVIASAIVERVPGFAYARGAEVTFRDTPRRGEPGIYEARNGELALATQGTTQAQRSFLAELFQGEFKRYPGQDALYFTTQCPVLHVPSHLALSSTIEQKAILDDSPAPLAHASHSAVIAPSDIPRLTKLAQIAPLLSQSQSFARIESSILDALHEWCKPGFNWGDWNKSDEAIALYNNDLLEQATPGQLEKLLTAIQRQDRFVEGTIEQAYKSNLLTRIARRAAAIIQLS
jgi:hypothetical protein